MKTVLKKIYQEAISEETRDALHYLKEIPKMRKELSELRYQLLFFKIIYEFQDKDNHPYLEEVNYLKTLGSVTPFPYPPTEKQLQEFESGYDFSRKLPYVVHNSKRLYFHKGFTVEAAQNAYKSYIGSENILGGGYRTKCPHQYQSKSHFVKEGDTFFDVGSAEGLFLLDVIDKVEKGYLIDPSEQWREALLATFAPYMDKVEIITKYASDTLSSKEVSIDSCIKGTENGLYIKIDVEGFEKKVLLGASKVLKSDIDVRVACCTYHRQNDAKELSALLKDMGYEIEFSDGYMLFFYDKNISSPYFRKGLLRAFRSK